MAKMLKKTTSPSAWVVNSKDRGRKSIKKGKVYLQDKEEFQIELFNPLQDCVLADIKLNGKSISESGLVLNPGQRFYLDCFIDDNKKFIFNTYEVEDTTEVANAIAKNGLLEVFFYKESVVTLNNWNNRFNKIIIEKHYPTYYPAYPNYPWFTPYYGNTNVYSTNSLGSGIIGSTTTSTSGDFYCSTNSVDLTNLKVSNNCYYSSDISITPISENLSIETGRVEKGSKSDQKFESIDMEFDKYYIASTVIQLLPDSRKPVETKEIKRNTSTSIDVLELLEKLSELHKSGILTNDEFNKKKVELLSKI